MILQRDGRLRPAIQESGCYYMSLLWYINKFTNASLSAETINDGMFTLFMKRGWLTEDAFVNSPQQILNWGGVDCVYTDQHEPPDRVCADNEFEILYWKHPQSGGHFTAGNGFGICTYDPWGVSKSATEGTLVSKRIFVRSINVPNDSSVRHPLRVSARPDTPRVAEEEEQVLSAHGRNVELVRG